MKKLFLYLYFFGQIIEVVGAVLIYRYQISKHTPKTKKPHISLEAPPGNFIIPRIDTVQENRDNKRYKILSKIGFWMLIGGVVLQMPISIYNCLF